MIKVALNGNKSVATERVEKGMVTSTMIDISKGENLDICYAIAGIGNASKVKQLEPNSYVYACNSVDG